MSVWFKMALGLSALIDLSDARDDSEGSHYNMQGH